MHGSSLIRNAKRIAVLTSFAWCLAPGVASAQSFISPLFGYNFAGDAGCPEITDCEDKSWNYGVAVGALGAILGGELEFAYAKDFFGEIPGFTSSVLTLMGNVMIAPRFGPVQPYVVGGLGMIKSNVELTPSDILAFDQDNTDFGWDFGGGCSSSSAITSGFEATSATSTRSRRSTC